MSDEPLLVDGCPLCEIIQKKINKKIYYPLDKDLIKSEFIISECPWCGNPIVIFRDHIPTILHDQWGRMIYIVRKTFEKPKINRSIHRYREHFYCHIEVD